jgi:hypothetical protein
MTCTRVTPIVSASALYARSARTSESIGIVARMRRSMSIFTVSSTRPVSRPRASRSYQPPNGSRTDSVIPSWRIALLLMSAGCPHQVKSATGCCGAAASRASRRKVVSLRARSPICPMIHVPGRARVAAARSESRTSADGGSGVGEGSVMSGVPGSTSPT